MSCSISWEYPYDYAIISKHSEGETSVIHIHQRISKESFKISKGVIRNRKSKMDRQCNFQMKNSQKDKQWSTKHHREN